MVTIRVTGFVQVLGAVRALGEAGKAVSGDIASWGSSLPYARPIETGQRGGRAWRRAGPALMFERGIAQTLPMVKPILLAAIPRGAASVGQAKRAVRDLGLANIKALTPVRIGRLRASIGEMTRPGGITMSTPIESVASRVRTRMTRVPGSPRLRR